MFLVGLMGAGGEGADSIVFNPHKGLGAQFDCAVRDVAMIANVGADLTA